MQLRSVGCGWPLRRASAPADGLASDGISEFATERALSLVALPELAAGACCACCVSVSSGSEGGCISMSAAIVLLLSLEARAGC